MLTDCIWKFEFWYVSYIQAVRTAVYKAENTKHFDAIKNRTGDFKQAK
jgi:hypothetical protein